jgi:leucyl/phenylalanyl-tRNA--protein transferase
MIPSGLLVSAYSSGWFPMAVDHGEIRWYSPDPRGVIPLDSFHVPSRLARVIRSGRFTVAVDRDFEAVMRACAGTERNDDDPGTWINREILESYVELHRLGVAHSVETWQEDRLVGGLYGVALGGAFFGESMFHHVTDASKVALAALVDRLRSRGFRLLDIQWVTPHLEQFGAIEIPRPKYLKLLAGALSCDVTFVDDSQRAGG